MDALGAALGAIGSGADGDGARVADELGAALGAIGSGADVGGADGDELLDALARVGEAWPSNAYP